MDYTVLQQWYRHLSWNLIKILSGTSNIMQSMNQSEYKCYSATLFPQHVPDRQIQLQNIQISPLASGLTFSEPGNHKTRKTHEPGIAGNMKAPEKPHNMEPDFRKNMAKWFQFIHISLLLPSQYFLIYCISTWDTFFYYLKKLSLSELNLAK